MIRINISNMTIRSFAKPIKTPKFEGWQEKEVKVYDPEEEVRECLAIADTKRELANLYGKGTNEYRQYMGEVKELEKTAQDNRDGKLTPKLLFA